MRASCIVLILTVLLSSTMAKPMAYEEHFDDLCPNGYGYGYGYGFGHGYGIQIIILYLNNFCRMDIKF